MEMPEGEWGEEDDRDLTSEWDDFILSLGWALHRCDRLVPRRHRRGRLVVLNGVPADPNDWCSTCPISDRRGTAWPNPDRTDRIRSIEHVESTQPRLEPDPGAWAWSLAVAHITTASSARLQPSRRRLGMFRRVDFARDHSPRVSVLFAGLLADTLACLLPTRLVRRLADVRSRPIAAALVAGTSRRDGSTRFARAPAGLQRIDGRDLE